MEKKFTPASPATAFASSVLPTPGGPQRSIPPDDQPRLTRISHTQRSCPMIADVERGFSNNVSKEYEADA